MQTFELSTAKEVVIKRINVPFGDILIFMVKAALATIPAAMIVGGVYFVIFTILMGSVLGRHHY